MLMVMVLMEGWWFANSFFQPRGVQKAGLHSHLALRAEHSILDLATDMCEGGCTKWPGRVSYVRFLNACAYLWLGQSQVKCGVAMQNCGLSRVVITMEERG